jgi:hypothetical protein
MKFKLRKSIAIALASTIMLQGCATNGTSSGESSNKAGKSAAVGGGIVAICMLAGEPLAKCLALGAAGGALAYAIQVAVENKKVKTAEEVNNEATLANKQIPKKGLKPLSFDVSLNPNAPVKVGDEVVLASTVKLYGNGNNEVKQLIQLYDQNGKPIGKPRVEPFNTEGNAAGAYTSTATYTIPSGWAGQKFNFKTAVLIDGNEITKNDNVNMIVLAEVSPNSKMVASKKQLLN